MPALISPHRPPRSAWNGTKPVAEENEVVGLPWNSFQRFGRIHAVMVRELSSIFHVRPNRAPIRPASELTSAKRTCAAMSLPSLMLMFWNTSCACGSMNQPPVNLKGYPVSSEAAIPWPCVLNVGRPRLAVELMS